MFRWRSRRYLLLLIIGYALIALVYQSYKPLHSTRTVVDEYLLSAQPQSALDVQILAETNYLSGRLIFLEQRNQPYYRILQFDLQTGTFITLFAIPNGAIVYQIASSPNTHTLLLTYSPPSDDNIPSRNGLYQLDIERSNSEPVLIHAAEKNHYFAYPIWSADEQFIFYVTYTTEGDNPNQRRIERLHIASGTVDLIAENATLPTLNADNTQLAYIHIDPENSQRSIREINLANNTTQELISVGEYPDLDSPFFYEDDLFFAVLESEQQDAFRFGATVYAHNNHDLPADWYLLSDGANSVQRLTSEALVLKGGTHAINDHYLVFVSTLGVYITDLELNTTTHILRSRAIRSLVWHPLP